MRSLVITAALLVSGVFYAQNAIEPQFTIVDNEVRAVYFYDNGQIQQEGTYKDGKLHGTWTSYDMNGNKRSVGEFNEGKKVGTWLHWADNTLSQVDYNESRIATVTVLIEEGMVGTDE